MKNFTEPENILIVRTDRIGDVILTTPAVAALRSRFPQARISMLISPSTRDLVEGNSCLDEILVDERLGRHGGWSGFWRLVRDIREKKFDLAINFHTKKRTNLFLFFAKVPRRLGYRNNKLGFLLTDGLKDTRPEGACHETQYCLDVLKPLGIDGGDFATFIPIQDEAQRWAAEFFRKLGADHPGVKFVALHLGASCPTKRWPVQYFAELVKKMAQHRQVFFVVIGTSEHRDMAQDLQRLSGLKNIFYDLTGRTSLARTVALLKQCDLLVSNDSGPVHIAAAFNTPVVSIFTRNQPGINPERWKPLGPLSRFVAPPVNMEENFAKGEVEDHGFLYRVTVEQVLDVVDAIF